VEVSVNKLRHAVVVAVVVLGLSVPLVAHHGAASFDTGTELTLKGTVTSWTWSNPHCFLRFDVRDENGTVKAWQVETQNSTDMSRRGFARTSFKPGDAVTVIVEPLKGGAPVGRIKSVVLANGQTLVAMAPAPTGPPPSDR
jgi:WD40 repeat protein